MKKEQLLLMSLLLPVFMGRVKAAQEEQPKRAGFLGSMSQQAAPYGTGGGTFAASSKWGAANQVQATNGLGLRPQTMNQMNLAQQGAMTGAQTWANSWDQASAGLMAQNWNNAEGVSGQGNWNSAFGQTAQYGTTQNGQYTNGNTQNMQYAGAQNQYGSTPNTQYNTQYTGAQNGKYAGAQNAQNQYGSAQNTQYTGNTPNQYGSTLSTQHNNTQYTNAQGGKYAGAQSAQNQYGSAQNTQYTGSTSNQYGSTLSTQHNNTQYTNAQGGKYAGAQSAQNQYGSAQNTQYTGSTPNQYGNTPNTQYNTQYTNAQGGKYAGAQNAQNQYGSAQNAQYTGSTPNQYGSAQNTQHNNTQYAGAQSTPNQYGSTQNTQYNTQYISAQNGQYAGSQNAPYGSGSAQNMHYMGTQNGQYASMLHGQYDKQRASQCGKKAGGLVGFGVGIGLVGNVNKVMAMQKDGKMIVVARNNNRTYFNGSVARYGVDGKLDVLFENPQLESVLPGYSARTAVVTHDQHVIVAYTNQDSFVLVRYNQDGCIDYNFDFSLPNPAAAGKLNAMALQSDNKILVGTDSPTMPLMRFLPNGSFDMNFTPDTHVANLGEVTAIAVTSGKVHGKDSSKMANKAYAKYMMSPTKDKYMNKERHGKGSSKNMIVVAGHTKSSMGGQSAKSATLARFDMNGMVDQWFQFSGVPGNVRFKGLAVQPNAGVLAVGSTDNAMPLLLRVTPTGLVDQSFSSAVESSTPHQVMPGSNNKYNAVAINPKDSNDIIAVGKVNNRFVVRRYNASGGANIANFGDRGTVGLYDGEGHSVAFTHNGEIITGGQIKVNSAMMPILYKI